MKSVQSFRNLRATCKLCFPVEDEDGYYITQMMMNAAEQAEEFAISIWHKFQSWKVIHFSHLPQVVHPLSKSNTSFTYELNINIIISCSGSKTTTFCILDTVLRFQHLSASNQSSGFIQKQGTYGHTCLVSYLLTTKISIGQRELVSVGSRISHQKNPTL